MTSSAIEGGLLERGCIREGATKFLENFQLLTKYLLFDSRDQYSHRLVCLYVISRNKQN